MKKYPKIAKLECPTCEGRGYLELNAYHGLRYQTKYSSFRNKIRTIGKDKIYEMSLREVAKALKLPSQSPQSAKHHIMMVEKLGWNNLE